MDFQYRAWHVWEGRGRGEGGGGSLGLLLCPQARVLLSKVDFPLGDVVGSGHYKLY